MQKLLGRNYKWWYLMVFRFKSRTASLFDSIFFVIGHLLVLLGTLITWWLANNKIIDTGLEQKWTYFVVGELFFALIFTFTEFVGFEFINGRHVTDLLKPQNYIKMKFFDLYGDAFAQNIVKISILLVLFSILISLGFAQFNLFGLLLFILLAPFSALIFYLSSLIVATSGFYLPRINGVAMNYVFISSLLMGRVFPLDLLFGNSSWQLLNPFGYFFFLPMQIYLGKYSPLETLYVFLGATTWCVIFYFLTNYIFKLGLKKNESVGL